MPRAPRGSRHRRTGGLGPGAAVAVLRRPALWITAVVSLARLAPAGWWRRWPPVPRPDPHYLAFRLITQYGDPHHAPEPHDVVTFLRWQRSWRRTQRRAARARAA